MKPRLKKSKEGQVENASSKEAFWQSERFGRENG